MANESVSVTCDDLQQDAFSDRGALNFAEATISPFLLSGFAANCFVFYLSVGKGAVTGDFKWFFANLAFCDAGYAIFTCAGMAAVSLGC